MINRFCQPIAVPFLLDINFLKNIQQSHVPNTTTLFDQFDTNDSIDPQLIKFFNQLNLTVLHAEVFYTPPRSTLPIHVDGSHFNNLTKLNWVFGANGSKMTWWEPNDSTSKIQLKQTVIGTNYLSIDDNQAHEVWSAEINQPTLVNAGCFHSVDNCTDEARWCASYVIGNASTNTYLYWDDAVTIFSPYFE